MGNKFCIPEEIKNSKFKDKSNQSIWSFISIVVSIFIVFFLSSIVFGRHDKWSEFGDSFGVINTLFSGLAFAAVTYSVILQKREIMQQLIELNQATLAHRETNESIREQLKEMKDQTELSLLPFPILLKVKQSRQIHTSYDIEKKSMLEKCQYQIMFVYQNVGNSIPMNAKLYAYDEINEYLEMFPINPIIIGEEFKIERSNEYKEGEPNFTKHIQFTRFLTIYENINRKPYYIAQMSKLSTQTFVIPDFNKYGSARNMITQESVQNFIEENIIEFPIN